MGVHVDLKLETQKNATKASPIQSSQYLQTFYFTLLYFTSLHFTDYGHYILLYVKQIYIFSLDIDECVADTNSCDVNAMCNNTEGSHFCTCRAGYAGEGKTCAGDY